MAADMAAADIQPDGNVSCQACPDDSNASPLCDLICLMSFAALPAPLEIERAVIHTVFARSPDRGTMGQFGSPDPTPPKFIIQV